MNRVNPFLPRFISSFSVLAIERFQLIKSLIINYQQVKPLAISLATGLAFFGLVWFIAPSTTF